jgi:beta-1,4-mannosyl-glycoprotein beta-1,4-N-acetylglucosaminyltransferase
MIIDTTMFNEDFQTLEIRLEELWEVVDIFAICESRFTFTGKPKPLHLTENFDKFKKYRKKIEIVLENKRHLTNIPMIREIHQRKRITKFVKSLSLNKEDLIIYSDCDEIPRREVIESLISQKDVNVLLSMRMFSNYINMEAGNWARARVVSKSKFKSIEDMRQDIFLLNLNSRKHFKKYFVRVPFYWTTWNYYFWKLPRYFKPPQISLVENAGWHFNNLLPKEKILNKIIASAHFEYNTEQVRQSAIENFLKGKDIYSGKEYKLVEVDESFPQCILKDLSKWSAFMFIADENY